MSWQCPECSRDFKHKNQPHSCVKVDINSFFNNKSPLVYTIYAKLLKEVKKFGEVKIHMSKSTINFSAEGTFLVLKPKKEWMDIEFLLDKEITGPPVYKSVAVYGSKYALYARLNMPEDIGKKLLGLLKEAYRLSAG